jgi:hypothetical protein
LTFGFQKAFYPKLIRTNKLLKITMPGLRYYIQSKRLKALDKESRILGIELNALISLKLSREMFESQEPPSLSFRLERCEFLLSKLCEDLDFVKETLSNFHTKTLE